MAKTVLFNVKVDAELKDAFFTAAEANDQNASQVVRDFMRNYIAERATAPEYREFLQQKVDRARDQIRQGLYRPAVEAEADFAKTRDGWV